MTWNVGAIGQCTTSNEQRATWRCGVGMGVGEVGQSGSKTQSLEKPSGSAVSGPQSDFNTSSVEFKQEKKSLPRALYAGPVYGLSGRASSH